jgi:8-oxo-dGTP pyrophosphatase MutT (NUDIX family)
MKLSFARLGITIEIVKTQLKELLESRPKHRIEDTARVPAAVLIPIYKNEGQCHIVFIKRTETVKAHKGQISFPGGSREEADKTLLDTALRESYEEIGLRPGDAEILGEMDDEVTTTSNYLVTPFVAAIPWPYRFVINRYEVDEIIAVPIPALLAEGCRRPDTEVLDGRTVASSAYHYRGRVIWGATARILNKFLDILREAVPEG